MRQSSIRRAKAFSALTAILLSLCACGESREAVGGYQPSAVFMEEGAYTEPLRVSRGGMELILDPGTLELTLRRDDGSVWSSYIAAPEGTADEDMAAYRTLLEISYYTKTGGKAGQEILLSSWKDCIARGQYAIEREDDGFLVTLVLGKADRSRVLPPAASRAFFEEMLEKLPSERAKRRMQAFYKLYDLAAASDDNQRREWLAVYPVLEETAIYVLQNGASDRDKDELEGYLVEAGYTLEEVEEESAYAGVWQKAEERPLFEIPLRLRLEDGDFTAEILTQGIGYDTSSYLLNRVRLLPFFAGLHQSDDGYLFFPDGSGAVIDLRTGRRRLTSKITARIYGDDLSVTDTLSDIRCRLPVFGAGGTAGAVLGIVEKGDAVAELTCEYGGTVNRSHYVYPTYIHCEYLTMNSQEEVSTGLNLSVWSSTAPADGFKVRYRFTGADTADYSALAALYRDYLTQAGLLVPGSAEPFRYQLETLGGVQTDERFLFFDVSKTARLTGLARSGELAASLAEYGVGDVALRVSGIAKGGLNGRAVSGLSVDGAVGGRGALEKLLRSMEEAGIACAPSFDLQTACGDGWLDGFSSRGDTARTLKNYVSGRTKLNPATGQLDPGTFVYLLRADKTTAGAATLGKALRELGAARLSLPTTGELLWSDNRKEGGVNRQESLARLRKTLDGLQESAALSFDGGNAYVFPYASHLYGVDYAGSGHKDYDEELPFLQMVLHGSVGYSTAPLNLEVDVERGLLRAIEAGAMPHFLLADENAYLLKDSPFSQYTSVEASYWLERSAALYKTAEQAIGSLSGNLIVRHTCLGKDLAMTEYDNGTRIYVNYSTEEAAVADGTVAGLSCLRVDKEGTP